jgi:hypothetical protein
MVRRTTMPRCARPRATGAPPGPPTSLRELRASAQRSCHGRKLAGTVDFLSTGKAMSIDSLADQTFQDVCELVELNKQTIRFSCEQAEARLQSSFTLKSLDSIIIEQANSFQPIAQRRRLMQVAPSISWRARKLDSQTRSTRI